MDERLVVPKALRPVIIRCLHYGHPGRDSMLSAVSNVIKTISKQKQVGELKCTEANQEIAIYFAGPFQNAIGAKKY